MATTTPDLKTYRGNCHCGAFVYEVQLPEIKSVKECNCSICFKKGYLWAFPSSPDHVKVVKGDEKDLTEYHFGSKQLIHKFCGNCASALMATSDSPAGAGYGLNVHCLQGVNTWDLEKIPFDGASLPPRHEVADYAGPEPTADVEDGKLYTGSCHCGAVTIALKSKPLDETYTGRIVECNCSICERNAFIWAYPKNEQVVLRGEENIGRYKFPGRKIDLGCKTFCKTCGVNFTNDAFDLTPEEVEELGDSIKPWLEQLRIVRPVNLRVLDDLDCKRLKIEQWDGFNNNPPQYVNP